MISMLPSQSIFMSYEHGISSFNPKNLAILKNRTGYGPTVVFHLNHERPWEFKDRGSLEIVDTYSSLEVLLDSYAAHPLVIRNYYYKPLLEHSHYYPVGPTLYGYHIGNKSKSNPLSIAYLLPPSKRGIWCYFKGTLTLTTTTTTTTTPTTPPTAPPTTPPTTPPPTTPPPPTTTTTTTRSYELQLL